MYSGAKAATSTMYMYMLCITDTQDHVNWQSSSRVITVHIMYGRYIILPSTIVLIIRGKGKNIATVIFPKLHIYMQQTPPLPHTRWSPIYGPSAITVNKVLPTKHPTCWTYVEV